MIDALPNVAWADKSYQNVVQGALDFYNTMNDYEKNYMDIYGHEQMEKFTEWKLELEKLGVKFEDTSEEDKKTSLDDILDSFNNKMNAILDKLNTLTENKTEKPSEGSDDKKDEDSEGEEDKTDKTETA